MANGKPQSPTGLHQIAAMHGGSVAVQWTRCGRAGCHCARGARHGPYFGLFYREAGRLRHRYIAAADVAAVEAACRAQRTARTAAQRERQQAWDTWRSLRASVREGEAT
jgi:hypothetical protein